MKTRIYSALQLKSILIINKIPLVDVLGQPGNWSAWQFVALSFSENFNFWRLARRCTGLRPNATMNSDELPAEGQFEACEGDASASPAGVRVIQSEALFQGQKEVHILHENQVYRLRRTRFGKLILQK